MWIHWVIAIGFHCHQADHQATLMFHFYIFRSLDSLALVLSDLTAQWASDYFQLQLSVLA